MNTMYADFNEEQFENYRVKLHKKMFWLLIYKDPEKSEPYQHINYDRYFSNLMKELGGLNSILLHPDNLLELLSVLQAAYNETQLPEFNFESYRKLILDAHALLDRLHFGGDQNDNI